MKVAYYSPLPPSRSGIADYSALLLPALRERLDVVVARPGRFRRAPKADLALYHVGNDPVEHGWIVEALRRNGVPAVVALHEFVLHHLVSGITLARGDVEGYCAALERDARPEGRELGLAVQQGRIEPLWETRAQEFPLAREVLDLATELIVHSRYVEGLAREAGYERPIRRVPMPAWPVPAIVPEPVDGRPVLGCFGHVNESKRVPQLLEAFARLGPEARLLLVGSWSPRLPPIELPANVIRRDYVPEAELWSLLAACDAVVSLRWPTMGETSAAAVRALSLGKPLVVSDVGAFRELPDEVAIKVPVGDGEVDALVDAMRRAAGNEEMSAAARRVAETEHRLDRVADLYAGALRPAVTGSSLSLDAA
jgi:glycosyltransferase involved in cell wall biosynthesis